MGGCKIILTIIHQIVQKKLFSIHQSKYLQYAITVKVTLNFLFGKSDFFTEIYHNRKNKKMNIFLASATI